MASFTAGTTFVDGVSNDVTAAKLGALVTNATPTSGFIQDRTAETVVGTNDTILIGDASDSNNLKRMTVANILKAPLVSTSGTIDNLTTGTTTSTAQIVTSGTTATFNSTTGTITNLSATTSTFLGTITGSTNVVNIGSGQIYKDASGKVGIGTTNPATKLDVYGDGSFQGIEVGKAGQSGNRSALIDFTGDDTYTDYGFRIIRQNTGANADAYLTNRGTGNVIVESAEAGQVLFNTNSTTRLTVNSSGNVGIGTTSPISPLHVRGSSVFGTINVQSLSANAEASISFYDSADTNADKWVIGKNVGGASADQFCFYKNGNLAVIDSSGNVGIGTASPATKLDVYGDGHFQSIEVGKAGQTGNRNALIDFVGDDTYSDYGLRIIRADTGANANTVFVHRGTGGLFFQTTEAGAINFQTTGTQRLSIDAANGTLTSQPTYDNTAAGSAVVVTSAGLIRRTSSSIKYKKDIENLYGSIVDNAISNLRPVWYRTKNPEGDDKSNWSHVGLIAEEVNSVEPRLVKYKTVEVSTGENGERIETQLENPIPEDVDYAKLSVILLSEVKAQKAKIASLEARIEALEAA